MDNCPIKQVDIQAGMDINNVHRSMKEAMDNCCGNKAELTPDKSNIITTAEDFMCWFIANNDIKNEYDIECDFIRAMYIAQGRGS